MTKAGDDRTLTIGESANVTIESTGTGLVNAWIDFDGNKSWGDAVNRF